MRTYLLLDPAQQFCVTVFWPAPHGVVADGYGPAGAWGEGPFGPVVAYGIAATTSGRSCRPVLLTEKDMLALSLDPDTVPEIHKVIADGCPVGHNTKPFLQKTAVL